MAEEVSTGGLVRFRYEKNANKSNLSEEKKKEIQEAYVAADERKRKEKLLRLVFWIIGTIALVALVLLLRFFL